MSGIIQATNLQVDNIKHSGGTSAMTVDSSGRIKYPSQVRFQAVGTADGYIQTATLPFPSVVRNIGSGYNSSTSKFTAPIDGCYFFTLHQYIKCDSGESIGLEFRKNDAELLTAAKIYFHPDNMNSGGEIDDVRSASAMIDLSASDTIHILFSGNGEYYSGTKWSQFSGYLLG